jgi:hypothetical protein
MMYQPGLTLAHKKIIMSLKLFSVAFIFVSLVSFSGYSQKTFLLSGKIVNLSGKTIPSGTVKLSNTISSALIKTVQVNKGNFHSDRSMKGNIS